MASDFEHHLRWLAPVEECLKKPGNITDHMRSEMRGLCTRVLEDNPDSAKAKELLLRMDACSTQIFEIRAPVVELLYCHSINELIEKVAKTLTQRDNGDNAKFESFKKLREKIDHAQTPEELFIAHWFLVNSIGVKIDDVTDRDALMERAEEFLQENQSPRAQMAAALLQLKEDMDVDEEVGKRLLQVALSSLEDAKSDTATMYLARKIVCIFSQDYETIFNILEKVKKDSPNQYMLLVITAIYSLDTDEIENLCPLGLRMIQKGGVHPSTVALFCHAGLMTILEALENEKEYMDERNNVEESPAWKPDVTEWSPNADTAESLDGEDEEDTRTLLYNTLHTLLETTPEWEIQVETFVAIARYLHSIDEQDLVLQELEIALRHCPPDALQRQELEGWRQRIVSGSDH